MTACQHDPYPTKGGSHDDDVIRCRKCGNYLPQKSAATLPASPAPTEQASELRTYVIMVRPGMTPVVKGPLPDKKWVEDMLRELYQLHADAQCMVIDMPNTSWPQSGIEWIDMYGDKRRTPIRAALAARQAPTAAPKEPLSEAQLDHIARSYFAEPHAQESVKNAIHDAFLEAQRTPDSRDAARLDFLARRYVGASDSERYLPFRVYWGGPKHDIRTVIDEAMRAERALKGPAK